MCVCAVFSTWSWTSLNMSNGAMPSVVEFFRSRRIAPSRACFSRNSIIFSCQPRVSIGISSSFRLGTASTAVR